MEMHTQIFNYWILLIPVLTAFAGWLTIKVAFTLLFRPVLPTKILGFTFQGIIPRYQKQMASHAGNFAAASFSLDSIEEKIKDPKNFEAVKPVIETHIDDFLRYKLKEQMPMISMFIGDKTIQSLKTVFIQEIENLFPRVMHQFAGNLKQELNIASLVTSKIESIAPSLIEAQLKPKLGKATLLGVLIGLLIGVLQLIILLVI